MSERADQRNAEAACWQGIADEGAALVYKLRNAFAASELSSAKCLHSLADFGAYVKQTEADKQPDIANLATQRAE